jgi:hypothetical protein
MNYMGKNIYEENYMSLIIDILMSDDIYWVHLWSWIVCIQVIYNELEIKNNNPQG